ncbi:MAG: hypothetical protein NC452_12695 [Eubacterium sp.]|nr:hypothetical protein [Eubacterium sp.]
MKKNYDKALKNRADRKVFFRMLVAVVLLYMAWKIPSLAQSDPTFPLGLGWGISVLFAAAAIVFLIYAWKKHTSDRKEAEITMDEEKSCLVQTDKQIEKEDNEKTTLN